MRPGTNLKELKIDSELTFDQMVKWGWIDASGQSLTLRNIHAIPRKQYFVLEEVSDVEDAELVQVGGKLYPIKEKDVKKLKKRLGKDTFSR